MSRRSFNKLEWISSSAAVLALFLATVTWFVSSSPIWAARGLAPETIAKHQQLTAAFTQTLMFNAKAAKGRNLVYGSDRYGYFTTDYQRVGRDIKLTIVPPGYQEAIHFYLCPQKRRSKDCQLISSKKFVSPLPMGYRSMEIIVEHGAFSSNYILVSASLPKSRIEKIDEILLKVEEPLRNSNRFSVIFILNRFGEVVWAYTPIRNRQFFYAYLGAKRPKRGTVGYVLGKKDGFFELVNMQGSPIFRVDSRSAERPYPIHHDFTLGKRGELLSISNRFFEVSGRGIEGAAARERVSFLSNTVIEIDPRSNQSKVRFDVLDHYLPQNEEHWLENKEKKRFVTWGKPRADRDFAHMNAIFYEKGKGYLLSLKHLDRLVMTDESMDKILWSIGPSKNDTFKTSGASWFSHQHDPKFLRNGDIVMFDNGFRRKKSRLLALRLDSKAKDVAISWQYEPSPSLFADNRSSVEELPSGNILALFVGPNVGGKKAKEDETRDFIIEYDPRSGKEVARMRLDFMTRSGGFRAVPLQELDQEQFITAR